MGEIANSVGVGAPAGIWWTFYYQSSTFHWSWLLDRYLLYTPSLVRTPNENVN